MYSDTYTHIIYIYIFYENHLLVYDIYMYVCVYTLYIVAVFIFLVRG